MQSAFSAAAFCPRGRGRLAAKVARLAREVATPWARPGQTSPPRARGRGLSPLPARHPLPGREGGGGGQNVGNTIKKLSCLNEPHETLLNTASTFYDVYNVFGSEFHWFLHFSPRIKINHANKAKSVTFRERNSRKVEKVSFLLILRWEFACAVKTVF